MTIGMILLIIAAILILLGAGQRVLDRLRLNDKLALLFIALIIVMNRTGFVSILSEGLLALFTPIVYAITGGLLG